MRTLRAKIALLLVASNISVVVLITLTMMYVFRTPTEKAVELLAGQLIQMGRLAQAGGSSDLGRPNLGSSDLLAPGPAAGTPDPVQTEVLRRAAMRLGTPLDLTVTIPADHRLRTASLKLDADHWLVTEFDPPSDPHLLGWLALITLSVGGISICAANRLSRPLALLESAVESVAADGTLPHLAERGPTEIRVTAAAINALSARLKRAVESRMRLVAAAGHDLRTPLTRMRLRAEFVTDAEERQLWLADIDELQRIAHSAIQLVRAETGQAATERLRLDELVRQVAADLRAQGHDITVTGTAPVCVEANRLALSRALRNLLINAATHGVRGSVGVADGVADGVVDGAMARITICDQGPGIAPEEMEEVFEPFFRADRARSQAIPGAGLGLTISREIIRKAGGEITLANGAQGGLVQVVDLPAVTAPAGAPA